MPALTPQFLFDLETRMQVVSAAEFQRLTAQLRWSMIAKSMTSQSARERLIWMLDTAGIQYEDRLGGGVEFEELISNTFEFENKTATGGMELNVNKFTDLDGGGVNLAAEWSRQISAKAAYWPEQQVWAAVCAGDQTGFTTYDGKKFFDTAHPLNPFDSSVGTFNNVFTGGASGAYPGACPIDASVTLDQAFINLQKVITYIRQIKMADGVTPRKLRARHLFVPPALTMRAQQLTNAKFIAQAATGGAGAADVEAVINNWGIGQPVEIDELGAAMTNGSDTSYYIGVEQLTSDPIGALVYCEREPFSIVYNTGMTDAQLQRANKLQWTTRGRNKVVYGHPYLLFKVKAS